MALAPMGAGKSGRLRGTAWWSDQVLALEAGMEIQPPWVQFPDTEPWWGGWRQGNSEAWFHEIWSPFWHRLSAEERLAYVDKWQPPEDWREYLLVIWAKHGVQDQLDETTQ
jgi:hypothetical protein